MINILLAFFIPILSSQPIPNVTDTPVQYPQFSITAPRASSIIKGIEMRLGEYQERAISPAIYFEDPNGGAMIISDVIPKDGGMLENYTWITFDREYNLLSFAPKGESAIGRFPLKVIVSNAMWENASQVFTVSVAKACSTYDYGMSDEGSSATDLMSVPSFFLSVTFMVCLMGLEVKRYHEKKFDKGALEIITEIGSLLNSKDLERADWLKMRAKGDKKEHKEFFSLFLKKIEDFSLDNKRYSWRCNIKCGKISERNKTIIRRMAEIKVASVVDMLEREYFENKGIMYFDACKIYDINSELEESIRKVFGTSYSFIISYLERYFLERALVIEAIREDDEDIDLSETKRSINSITPYDGAVNNGYGKIPLTIPDSWEQE